MRLDPATVMLVREWRTDPDVEWVLGGTRTRLGQGEFDLVVMAGHPFQSLVDDEGIRVWLRAVRAALADGGRFVFETRNPATYAWGRWTPDRMREFSPWPDGPVNAGST
ncbi:hypothetical protein ACIRU3_30415 [Streptomyces sp. NPDC101151]|uniref:hypothetical protein n=1 Tax=Streptomyces sp. NPDC101151 TaxID=3366115 RepID=UPI0037F2E277